MTTDSRTTVLAVLGTGVVDPSTPVARADDAGLTRGDGCFEGCRLRRVDGEVTIAKLDRHLARMSRSAAALDIAFDEAAWRDLITQALAAWERSADDVAADGPDEASVKLLLSRGPAGGDVPTGFVWIADLGPDHARLRRDGLRVATLRRGFTTAAFADAPWLLGGVKTLSYAVNMAAAREADRRGVDDVIFVSDEGVVLESPTSTVVWATGVDGDARTLHTTPTGDTGILGGTTQELLFDRAAEAGWRTAHTLADVDDLHAADVVWLVSSVRGPVDVVELDGKARERRPGNDADIRRLCGF